MEKSLTEYERLLEELKEIETESATYKANFIKRVYDDVEATCKECTKKLNDTFGGTCLDISAEFMKYYGYLYIEDYRYASTRVVKFYSKRYDDALKTTASVKTLLDSSKELYNSLYGCKNIFFKKCDDAVNELKEEVEKAKKDLEKAKELSPKEDDYFIVFECDESNADSVVVSKHFKSVEEANEYMNSNFSLIFVWSYLYKNNEIIGHYDGLGDGKYELAFE